MPRYIQRQVSACLKLHPLAYPGSILLARIFTFYPSYDIQFIADSHPRVDYLYGHEHGEDEPQAELQSQAIMWEKDTLDLHGLV
jgi:hypothetical protein